MRDNTKSITIGGRISEPDHEFLMEFPLAGKVTVSEKLRHICTFFRQYHTNLEGYSNCLEQINIMLRPAVNDIKEMENQEGVHSELVTKLLTMVPELLAFLVTQRRPRGRLTNGVRISSICTNWSPAFLRAPLHLLKVFSEWGSPRRVRPTIQIY